MRKKSLKLKHGNFQIIISPKNGTKTGKRSGKRRKKKQTGGFLNRYDFAYAGRDVVNQAGKIAPDIINKATSDINHIENHFITILYHIERKIRYQKLCLWLFFLFYFFLLSLLSVSKVCNLR